MIKPVTVLVLLLAAALLVYAAFQPDHFRVERSLGIHATPERLFTLIDDFHQWEKWSPWELADPAVQRTYSGSAYGVGAVYEWHGNQQLGHGRMEIVDSTPPSAVQINIDFFEPMEAHNRIEFTLQPEDGGTRVTQAMYGPSPYLGRLLGIFFSMDRMVGTRFEEGLGNLRAIAER